MTRFLPLDRTIIAIFLIGFLEAAIFGFSFPYFSLVLQQKGLSEFLIGANASLSALSVVFIGPWVPRLILRLGYRGFSILCFTLAFLAFLALLLFDDIAAWFVMRALLGCAFGGLWIVTEAWLNHVITDDRRGRFNAAFQMTYSVGFLTGPSLTYIVGFGLTLPLLTIGGFAVFGIAIAMMAKRTKRVEFEGHSTVSWTIAVRARELIFISVLAGTVESALYALLPVFGMGEGLTQAQAVGLLVGLSVGAITIAMPLGWAADRFNRKALMVYCTAIAAASVFSLSLFGSLPAAVWLLSVIAGGTIIGLYNLALIVLGETYSGSELPVAATGFSMGYAIGSSIGALIGGLAMEAIGNSGLPIICSLMLFAYVLLKALFRSEGAYRVNADPSKRQTMAGTREP